MITFEESGLQFVFDDDNCYRVENDPLVVNGKGTSSSNNMACECISVIEGKHCFIEVKKSAPKSSGGTVKDLMLNGKPMPKNWVAYDNYRAYLRDISKKFVDSFYILRSLIEERHGQERLKALNLPNKTINFNSLRFILIINLQLSPDKNVDKQALSDLQDALKNEMRPFLSIWRIPDTSIKVVLPNDAKKILNIPIK